MTDLDQQSTMPTLRAYQHHASRRASACLIDMECVLLVAPTGSGKTTMASVIAKVADGGRSAVLIAHRAELIAQARSVMPPTVECFSLQQLARRKHAPPCKLAIIDECHHIVGTEQWGWIAREYKERGIPILGLTATPCRQDGAAFGEVFDRIIVAAQVQELTDRGWLVPARVMAPATRQRGMAEDPVAAWKKLGAERRAIVFCRDVKHAQDVAAKFCAEGISAACVEGNMCPDDRARAFADFRAGRFAVLTNVMVATEGYDDPGIGCVILARGCSHAGAWLQIVGRALRPSPGKTEALIIDLCGSVHEHGLPADPREYSLEGKAIRTGEGLDPIRQCRHCGGVFRAAMYVSGNCPRCGAPMPVKKNPAIRRAELREIRATHTSGERAAALRQLWDRAQRSRFKPGWAMIQFKARYSRWPTQAEKSAAGIR